VRRPLRGQDRKFGVKTESLEVSRCLPVCSRKRITDRALSSGSNPNWRGARRSSAERPVSRQPACKPGSVRRKARTHFARDGHSSLAPVARRLEQPTRAADPDIDPGDRSPCRPYSVLLPVGFAVPPPLPEARCALAAPFHPCRGNSPAAVLTFSVALSLGSPPPDVIRHRMSMEPGLSSPATFRSVPGRPSGRLTR